MNTKYEALRAAAEKLKKCGPHRFSLAYAEAQHEMDTAIMGTGSDWRHVMVELFDDLRRAEERIKELEAMGENANWREHKHP